MENKGYERNELYYSGRALENYERFINSKDDGSYCKPNSGYSVVDNNKRENVDFKSFKDFKYKTNFKNMKMLNSKNKIEATLDDFKSKISPTMKNNMNNTFNKSKTQSNFVKTQKPESLEKISDNNFKPQINENKEFKELITYYFKEINSLKVNKSDYNIKTIQDKNNLLSELSLTMLDHLCLIREQAREKEEDLIHEKSLIYQELERISEKYKAYAESHKKLSQGDNIKETLRNQLEHQVKLTYYYKELMVKVIKIKLDLFYSVVAHLTNDKRKTSLEFLFDTKDYLLQKILDLMPCIDISFESLFEDIIKISNSKDSFFSIRFKGHGKCNCNSRDRSRSNKSKKAMVFSREKDREDKHQNYKSYTKKNIHSPNKCIKLLNYSNYPFKTKNEVFKEFSTEKQLPSQSPPKYNFKKVEIKPEKTKNLDINNQTNNNFELASNINLNNTNKLKKLEQPTTPNNINIKDLEHKNIKITTLNEQTMKQTDEFFTANKLDEINFLQRSSKSRSSEKNKDTIIEGYSDYQLNSKIKKNNRYEDDERNTLYSNFFNNSNQEYYQNTYEFVPNNQNFNQYDYNLEEKNLNTK